MDPATARALASSHLAGPLPRRWAHVQGVALRADRVGGYLPDGQVLIVAAWLHDLGYAPPLAATEFHPLDGARVLRDLGADDCLCGLVAFHSAALHEAEALGLAAELSEFTDEPGIIRDLLWYLDMTTGPDGDTVSFDHRMADVRDRYPSGHYVIRALDRGMSDRKAAVARARSWIVSVGLADHV